MTYVNTETEDFSAKELNGVLQLLLIFFRRLTIYIYQGYRVLACKHELTFQFEQLTYLLCVCLRIVSGEHTSKCSHSLLPVVQATSKGVEPGVICHSIYTHRRAIPLPKG